jgi:hypothetical protein
LRRRGSIEPSSATTSPASIADSSCTVERPKESSWRFIRAAREVAASRSSSSARPSSLSAAALSRRSAEAPPITASRLLKSWATPLARLPTSSIFCDWIERRSASSRSRAIACERRCDSRSDSSERLSSTEESSSSTVTAPQALTGL